MIGSIDYQLGLTDNAFTSLAVKQGVVDRVHAWSISLPNMLLIECARTETHG